MGHLAGMLTSLCFGLSPVCLCISWMQWVVLMFHIVLILHCKATGGYCILTTLTQVIQYEYSDTSIKQPPIKRPTFIWQSAAKVPEKYSAIHCNKNLYSVATSIKQPQPASCCPKDDFLSYTSLNGQEVLKLDVFSQRKLKELQCGNIILMLWTVL